MDESEFSERVEKLFSQIEDVTDALDEDIEAMRSGNVLTLESQNGEQVVINSHAPSSEVWLASRAKGVRFSYIDGQWRSSKGENLSIWDALAQAVSYICGHTVVFNQKI